MLSLPEIFLIVALIFFGVPAVRAVAKRTFDYTNSGLAFLVLAMLVSGGVF